MIKLAISAFLKNLSILIYFGQKYPNLIQSLTRLKFLSGGCIRICLNILSISISSGLSGVSQLHVDAVQTLFFCMANCLLAKYPDKGCVDVESLKLQRICLVGSAASSLLSSSSSSDQTLNDDSQSVDDLAGWEHARKIINYWANLLTANRTVRLTASKLLSLLE